MAASPTKTGVCKTCGKAFEYPKYQKNRKYCSMDCAAEKRREGRPDCPICGKRVNKKPSAMQRHYTCSNACTSEWFDRKTIAKIEEIIQEPFGGYLRRRYVQDRASLREIEQELGLGDNGRRMRRFMARYNISARSKAEVVKVQHEKDPSRGQQFSLWLSSEEARKRSALTRQRRPKLSGLEGAALSMLRSIGLDPIPQYAVGVHNIDLALPAIKVAIEINGGEWHERAQRKREDDHRDDVLRQQGWSIHRFRASEFGALLEWAQSLA